MLKYYLTPSAIGYSLTISRLSLVSNLGWNRWDMSLSVSTVAFALRKGESADDSALL